MLSHLNSILKSTLASRTPEKVPLSQELELVGNYLAIEQVRFADRLRIEINVDPAAVDGLVPCFLLQPIVENAIRHGIAHCESEGLVEAWRFAMGTSCTCAFGIRGRGWFTRNSAGMASGLAIHGSGSTIFTRAVTKCGRIHSVLVGLRSLSLSRTNGAHEIRTLIADDEPLARERLRFLLSAEQEVEVAGECRNGREVIAALKESRFDVLFLDIQMPGKDGFDVIDQVGPAQMPVTVFVTAHNEYAVQAFEVDALDYLTKPVEPERLRATLVRVKERIASQAALMTQEQMKSVLQQS